MGELISLRDARDDAKEQAVCEQWDKLQRAVEIAYEWRDMESVEDVMEALNALLPTIEIIVN